MPYIYEYDNGVKCNVTEWKQVLRDSNVDIPFKKFDTWGSVLCLYSNILLSPRNYNNNFSDSLFNFNDLTYYKKEKYRR